MCKSCFLENTEAVWLTWLKCIHPNKHHRFFHGCVTVVLDREKSQLVQVRTKISHLNRVPVNEIALCGFIPGCYKEDKCKFAHSPEELNYWRWGKVRKILDSKLDKIVSLIIIWPFNGKHISVCIHVTTTVSFSCIICILYISLACSLNTYLAWWNNI